MKKGDLILLTVCLSGILFTCAAVFVVKQEAAAWPLPFPQSAPAVTIDPQSLDFGDQVVSTTSKSKRITVTNTGGRPLYISSVNFAGDDPDDFSLDTDQCTGATVAPRRACVIDVSFSPSSADDSNARLKLTDNAASSPQTVALTGTGINPEDVPAFP
jgi:hypothetical protein